MTTAVVQEHPNEIIGKRKAKEFERYVGKVVPVHIHMQSHISKPIPMMYAGAHSDTYAWFILDRVEPAQDESYLRGFSTHLAWVERLEGHDAFLLNGVYQQLPGRRVTSSDAELERIVKLWRNRTVNNPA